MHSRADRDDGPVYVTPLGLERLNARLAELRRRHEEICEQRTVAHELSGDGWHDNPHLNYLQQMEANSTWKIRELEELVARARIVEIEDGRRPTERIRLGSVVTLSSQDPVTGDEREQTVEIVGHQESDQKLGRVAYDAPLGRALLGRRAGDFFEVRLPEGRVEVEILELHADRGPLDAPSSAE
jgi:transcription elongation factor GreA